MAKKKTVKKKTARKKPVKKAVKAKKPVRKAAKAKKPAPPPAAQPPHVLAWRQPLSGEEEVGVVKDYFGHVGVIALILEKPLAVGDKIHVRGHTTDLAQTVESMQIGHETVQRAGPGDDVGVKVSDKCRTGDYVYRSLASA